MSTLNSTLLALLASGLCIFFLAYSFVRGRASQKQAKDGNINFLRLLLSRILSKSQTGVVTNFIAGGDMSNATIHSIGFFCEYTWPMRITSECKLEPTFIPTLEGWVQFSEGSAPDPLKEHKILHDKRIASLSFTLAKSEYCDARFNLKREMSLAMIMRDKQKNEIGNVTLFFESFASRELALSYAFDNIIIIVRRRVRRYNARKAKGLIHG